jgi:DNA invertase Pin-like site-specific DNA recombinase/5'-deoxynucleotidase YfbR-like HD superfamily hydrolase
MLKGQINYNVAIYCRLSKDDGNIGDSSSIDTQKAMLTRYVQENKWTVYDYFIDDGYSGLSFNRPEFKRMIDEIDKGNVNLVITKDLSRFGRNYLESGTFIEIYFPEKGVRYIAVNDGVDTLNNNNMDITPFKNILNEMYALDISKKVKTGFRTKLLQGKYTATNAPYGYIKDPNDKNHLIINEEVAPIVREIFAYAKEGLGISQIRKKMIEKKHLRPAAYAQSKGTNYNRFFEDNEDNKYFWSNNSVRGILRNPVYAGCIVGNKRSSKGFKSNKRDILQPEDWIIVENCHEPIIEPEEFRLIQKLITSRRQQTKTGYNNIFSRLIKCETCGYAMSSTSPNRRKRDTIIDSVGYCCNNYKTFGKSVCTQHFIEARDLHEAVLADIRKHARMAMSNNEKMVNKIIKKLCTTSKTEKNKLTKAYNKASNRLNEIDRLFAKLYEDRVSESITERNYKMMLMKYQSEQEQLTKRIDEIQASLKEDDESIENVKSFTDIIKEYDGIEELTAPLLNKLINKITISERKEVDGKMEQTIKIYYNFVGRI